MERFLVLLLIQFLGLPIFAFADDVYVNEYYRQDGTYVKDHYRSAPDGQEWNNYGSQTSSYTKPTYQGFRNTAPPSQSNRFTINEDPYPSRAGDSLINPRDENSWRSKPGQSLLY